MSYRLINANDIAAICPGVNDMPCIYADLPSGLDGGHYDMRYPNELQRENAKLRDELAKWELLTDGIDLPEYPVVQFVPKDLERENARLRDSLKALVTGTYAELCSDRDQPQCRECSMRRGDDTCVAADAMELRGIDMYGEPLGGRQ